MVIDFHIQSTLKVQKVSKVRNYVFRVVNSHYSCDESHAVPGHGFPLLCDKIEAGLAIVWTISRFVYPLSESDADYEFYSGG